MKGRSAGNDGYVLKTHSPRHRPWNALHISADGRPSCHHYTGAPHSCGSTRRRSACIVPEHPLTARKAGTCAREIRLGVQVWNTQEVAPIKLLPGDHGKSASQQQPRNASPAEDRAKSTQLSSGSRTNLVPKVREAAGLSGRLSP